MQEFGETLFPSHYEEYCLFLDVSVYLGNIIIPTSR